MMRYRYIAIEGNIGAGKTTLATALAAHYGAQLVLEEFAGNSFLPRFYTAPERYALPLELSFVTDRYEQLRERTASRDAVIADYSFAKSRLFASINLPEAEYKLFRKLFDIMDGHLPQPDLLIYLHAPVSFLQKNIARRGRSYEAGIAGEYLEQVQHAYQQFLKEPACPTLIIDSEQARFREQPDHLAQLIYFLEKEENFSVCRFTFEQNE